MPSTKQLAYSRVDWRRIARWQELQQRIGQTRCAIQQTEMSFLVPPAPKPKARFMNLAPTLQWAENVLRVLRQPPTVVSEQVSSRTVGGEARVAAGV